MLCSLDDDGAEDPPVGLAGVEQCSDAVVLEVCEAVADAFDPFDPVVQRLSGPLLTRAMWKLQILANQTLRVRASLFSSGSRPGRRQWSISSESIARAVWMSVAR